MKFDVKYTDGFGCYIVTTEDGQAALADTQTGQVNWSNTEEHFLRFGPFYEVTETPPDQVLADLDDLLEGRVKFVEVDPKTMMKHLKETFGDLFEEDSADEG